MELNTSRKELGTVDYCKPIRSCSRQKQEAARGKKDVQSCSSTKSKCKASTAFSAMSALNHTPPHQNGFPCPQAHTALWQFFSHSSVLRNILLHEQFPFSTVYNSLSHKSLRLTHEQLCPVQSSCWRGCHTSIHHQESLFSIKSGHSLNSIQHIVGLSAH
jgi:hypothetical protein